MTTANAVSFRIPDPKCSAMREGQKLFFCRAGWWRTFGDPDLRLVLKVEFLNRASSQPIKRPNKKPTNEKERKRANHRQQSNQLQTKREGPAVTAKVPAPPPPPPPPFRRRAMPDRFTISFRRAEILSKRLLASSYILLSTHRIRKPRTLCRATRKTPRSLPSGRNFSSDSNASEKL